MCFVNHQYSGPTHCLETVYPHLAQEHPLPATPPTSSLGRLTVPSTLSSPQLTHIPAARKPPQLEPACGSGMSEGPSLILASCEPTQSAAGRSAQQSAAVPISTAPAPSPPTADMQRSTASPTPVQVHVSSCVVSPDSSAPNQHAKSLGSIQPSLAGLHLTTMPPLPVPSPLSLTGAPRPAMLGEGAFPSSVQAHLVYRV